MLRLRPYKDSDAAAILSWCKDEVAYYNWCAGILGDFPATEAAFNENVHKLMGFTALEDDRVAGFFSIRIPGEDKGIVRFGFVTVDSELRGKGYGKEMLRLGLTYAFDVYRAKKVTLGVIEDNLPAYKAYKAVGFTEEGTVETFHNLGREWRCVEMEIAK